MEVSGHLHYAVPGEKVLLSIQQKVSQTRAKVDMKKTSLAWWESNSNFPAFQHAALLLP
jgi:hypothetical protein